MSQLLTQFQDLQYKVNSLSDAREFYDPETGSSSGATHVPSQPSTIPSPRTKLCCDCGLPRDTQNGPSIAGHVFERPPARDELSSTIFNNSKILASSSQLVRPDTTETTRKRDSEMKRESLNTPIPSHRRSSA